MRTLYEISPNITGLLSEGWVNVIRGFTVYENEMKAKSDFINCD